jgi:stage V sporulation protein K
MYFNHSHNKRGIKMIAENYKQQLIKEAKQLDALLGTTGDFEKTVLEITNEENEGAVLELIKNLEVLVKKQLFPKMEQKQERMLGILCQYLGAERIDTIFQGLKDSSNVPLSVLMHQLDELVGLEDVKHQVRDLIDYHQIQCLRVKNGLKKSDKTLHMAFLGNPGTAKTTVARIVGRIYKSIGLLSKGQFIEASRTDLIAEYQGQTAIKVKRLINRAKGGVLFIDEAYSITENEHSDSYGRECLTELTKALEDYRDDLVVIVAGYTKLMEQFFESNPGLKSRFNTFILFNDYNLDELVKIFLYLCQKNDYSVEPQALEQVQCLLKDKLDTKGKYFSNGRLVRNLFDDITMNQSRRLAKLNINLTKESLTLITKEDIPLI